VEHLIASGESVVAIARGQIVSEPKVLSKNVDDIFSPWEFREDQTTFLFSVQNVPE
jgi:hypothetical protein